MAKRTDKEIFMKRVGKWLGAGYRFHRCSRGDSQPRVYNVLSPKGLLCFMPSNFRRIWKFEWWEKVPGNPLNRYFLKDLVGSEKLPRSECQQIDLPENIVSKEEAVDYVLLESEFLDSFGKQGMKSYEALELAMQAACVDKAPYMENVEMTPYLKNLGE